MKTFISLQETDLAEIQGGDGTYARDYGQFLGGYVGAMKYDFVPGLGLFIQMGFGVWAALQN